MANNRMRFVVTGRVQRGGFRVQVAQIASQLGVKGVVRNLKDGSVEIFCEADEKTLEEFKKMIDIKSPLEDLFGVNVGNIDEYGENNENYVNPPEKFGYFNIDYMDEDLLKASVERSEIGILVLSSMHQDLKEGQKGLIEGQKDVREEQKSMHQDMNKRFDWVAEKYGDIGIGINSIKDDLGELKSMGNDVKEMKNLFAKLVNHIVKE